MSTACFTIGLRGWIEVNLMKEHMAIFIPSHNEESTFAESYLNFELNNEPIQLGCRDLE